MVKSVVVAGDSVIDWIAWEKKPLILSGEKKPVLNWMYSSGLTMIARPGGAALTGLLAETSFQDNKQDATVEKYYIDAIESIPPTKVLHSNAILKDFPIKGDSGGKRVFRVSQFYGYTGPETGVVETSHFRLPDTKADMVILDDAGNGFRDAAESWPRAIREEKLRPLIILKMSQPLGTGKLWEHLINNHGDCLVTVVSANDLRDLGVHISYRLSWERVAEDFVWQMQNNLLLQSLLQCRNLIVRFGIDGAIHYTKKNDRISAVLYYDPELLEDGFFELHQGKMQGLSGAFVAGLAPSLLKNRENFADAIRNGILGARNLFTAGFGPVEKNPDYIFNGIFTISDNDRKRIASIPIPVLSHQLNEQRSGWTILGTKNRVELEEITEKMVVFGKDPSMSPVPVGSYEGLKTVDRNEIESYQSIKNLFSEFLNNPKVTRPLSIAVFGPPGSGKSFGVTQLALSIEKKKIEKMEFNLSQFRDPGELTIAFHKIRDAVLKGKVPLAFFDEFDANLDGRFGWLKYFLAPMQDGEFRDGEMMHPLGKAIFIFAGATCHRFDEFRYGSGDDAAKTEHARQLAEAKGTDFGSRLRGYIDIMGCNRSAENDRFAIIRRAVLLRSLLSRNAGHLIDEHGVAAIDPCVVRAFLKVPDYRHGARSMEAIIDMSLLSAKRRFAQSALPSMAQLQIHVDADRFMRLVLQDVVFNDAVESIAKEIHNNQYRATLKKMGKSLPHDVPWEDLPEEIRESNRGQAKHIPEKLKAIGCGLWPGKKGDISLITLDENEIEVLARLEHIRWMKEKREAGYTFGKTRNDTKKIHPDLVEWDELSDEEKRKDRDFVRAIPLRLADVGFEIYRYDEKDTHPDNSLCSVKN
jgi:hypothetical protein